MANVLYGYVDGDHAGSTEDSKSVGGYVLMLNGGAVSWEGRKIKVVSVSSFESKWYSTSICGCEVVVMRRLKILAESLSLCESLSLSSPSV
jgi:hypothetical protein